MVFRVQELSLTNRRETNQDSWCWGTYDDSGSVGIIAGVFDGVGGLSQGHKASQHVVSLVERQFHKGDISTPSLLGVFSSSQEGITSFPEKAGTTATVVRLHGGQGTFLHLGDSRLIKWSPLTQSFEVLTADHTALAEKSSQGISLTPELIAKYSSLLTRALGKTPFTPPDQGEFSYSPGDYFILCSDGFWHTFCGYFDRLKDSTPEGILQATADLAVYLGEPDNITALLIEVVS